MNYFLLILGFYLLIKGADFFVEGSSSIAKTLKIPSIIVGLTIVAFGTSAPEACVSIMASLDGQNGMAMGNVIGSNIFNLLMVTGTAAFIKTLYIEKSMLFRQFPFLIFTSVLVVLLILDSTLSRFDGLLLLILFIGYVFILVKSAIGSREPYIDETSISSDSEAIPCSVEKSFFKSVIYSIIGIIGIIIGGDLVVTTSSHIASTFGVSDQLIGLTIVAIGTSLPEFVTSIVACTKEESDIAIGNIIGSNIFNLLFVLGASSVISDMTINKSIIIDTIFMILVTLLTYFFCLRKKDINKIESLILMITYFIYMSYLISAS